MVSFKNIITISILLKFLQQNKLLLPRKQESAGNCNRVSNFQFVRFCALIFIL